MSTADSESQDFDALAEEYVERLRCGEVPDLEHYARRHPRLAERIRRLFPLLSVMEGVSSPLHLHAPRRAAATAAEAAGTGTPERIGDYRVHALLGQGGMGRVYRAQTPDGEGTVAVKVIHPHLVADPGCLARFLREAEVGRRVRHPHVVHTLDAGVLEQGGIDVPYLVLDYVEGQTLRALLDEVGRVPERLCLHVGRCIAQALQAIHEQGIVHRDIKPANVLITADETVKVMDLGVALLQDEALRLSGTGDFVGSLLYAAPEQIEGRTLDARADLYALGLTLFEMAAGHLPRRRDGRFASSLLAHTSPFFAAVVETLLAREADARFADAADFLAVLREGEDGGWWRGRRERRSPTHWFRAGRLQAPELLGRERELHLLDQAFVATRDGGGRFVLLEGEAGIGKSHLVHEWLDGLERRDSALRALIVRHSPGEEVAAVPPLREALLATFAPETLTRHIEAALGKGGLLAQALRRQISSHGSAEDGGLPAGALGTGYIRLLRALGRAHPLVVVVEDLHFASESARAFILQLGHALAGDPVLVVATTRTRADASDLHDLRGLAHATHLELQGLSSSACRALVRAARPGDGPLVQEATLIRQSDGNPFFLLEMVRAVEDRADDGGEGGRRGTSIPRSVRSIIEVRLARLTEAERELIEAGACVGFEFDPTLVAETADVGLLGALKCFARLDRAAGLLQGVGANYVFRHHLVQEVLHDEMHPTLRRAYHAAIARVLLQRIAAAPYVSAQDAVALCQHAYAGGEQASAAPYVIKALEGLIPRGEYARAIELAEQALDAPGLPARDRIVIQRALGVALQSMSRYEEARTQVEEAMTLADRHGDLALQAQTRRELGSLVLRFAEHEEAVRLHEEATRYARATGDALEIARARAGFAGALMLVQRLADAREHAEAALATAEAEGEEPIEIEAAHVLGQLDVREGHDERGQARLERALELARRAGNRGREVGILSTLAHLAYMQKDFERALAGLRECMDLARELGKTDDLPHLKINAASCLEFLGRLEEAQRMAEEAVADAVAVGHVAAVLRARIRLAEIFYQRGRLTEALPLLQATSEEAARVEDAPGDAAAARILMETWTCLGRFDEAAAVLEGWLQRHERRRGKGARSQPAARRLRAVLHERAGRFEEARALFEQAYQGTADGDGRGPRPALDLGRVLLRLGETERARALFHEAVEQSRGRGSAAEETLAAVYLATLPGEDALAARVLLERNASTLRPPARVRGHAMLWEATHDLDDLRRAHAGLMDLVEHAPAEHRASMLQVPICRRVLTAWEQHGPHASC